MSAPVEPAPRRGLLSRLSFQQRLGWFVVSVMAASLGTVLLFTYRYAQQRVEEEVAYRLDRAVATIKRLRESDLAERARGRQRLAAEPLLRELLDPAADPARRVVSAERLRRELDASVFALLGPDGQTLAGAGEASPSLRAATGGLVREANERGGASVTLEAGGSATEASVTPVRAAGRDGAVLGYALVAEPFRVQRLQNYAVAVAGRVELRAADGRALLASNPPSEERGEERSSVIPIPQGLELTLLLPTADVAGPLRDTVWLIGLVSALCLFFGSLAMRLGAARMAGPLRGVASIIGETGALVRRVSDYLDAGSRRVGAAVEDTQRAVENMRRTLDQNAEQAERLEDAVLQTTGAMRQIGASIGEVSRNAQDAVATASEAVADVETTNRTVAELDRSAEHIDEVTRTINQVARRIHMLALNATIEAAQAGDAGRGFAVVAAEVRDLARQTASATDDIGARIADMQARARGAIDAISRLVEVFERIARTQASIAAAVEQQSATTDDVSRIAEDMARLTHTVASATQEGCREGERVMESIRESARVTRDSFALTRRLEESVAELQLQSTRIRELFFGERPAHAEQGALDAAAAPPAPARPHVDAGGSIG